MLNKTLGPVTNCTIKALCNVKANDKSQLLYRMCDTHVYIVSIVRFFNEG